MEVRSKNVYLALSLGMLFVIVFPFFSPAQEPPDRFQKREQKTELPITIFHSQQSANLPTAEVLAKGEWLFEISHRFFPPVSAGLSDLWGLDGPVANRFGIAYALSDRTMIGFLRTNYDDNFEINVKVNVLSGKTGSIPIMIGLMSGLAWNMSDPGKSGASHNESQAYGQIMINALLGDRLAFGIVPTLLRNPRIQNLSPGNAFVLGLHGQIYLSDQLSFLSEWIISEERPDLTYDSGTFGIELETGGHFFKIILTNQYRMNPTQFLGGTPYSFEMDEWRFGFNVTRLLTF
jgi:hypothetical protein